MVDSVKMMEQIEKQGLGSSLPILQRLDRVERLVQFLEEKKSLSRTGSHSFSSTVVITNTASEDEWKTLSSALEEVHYKGTLLERLEMIEKRVLQLELSMEMNVVNKFVPSEHSTTLSKSEDHSIKVQANDVEVSQTSKMPKRRVTSIRPTKWLGLSSLRACGKRGFPPVSSNA